MGDPATLHKVMRSWLLSEDPYGLNQRQEPTYPDMRAPAAGEAAVGRELGTDAASVGQAAVDQEMDRANTEAWRAKMEGRKAQRAQAGKEGRAAVADALRPSAVRAMIAAKQQPPAYTPEESAGLASAVGQSAVEGAIRPVPQGPAGWYPPSPPSEADVSAAMARMKAGILSPESQAYAEAHGLPLPAPTLGNRPGYPIDPQTTGYAPSAKRASHWGVKSVENELDKPSE